MKFIAGAIPELISNLIPNNKQFYLSKDWVTDKLIPILKTMNQRAIEQKGMIESNRGAHSNTIIVCVVLGSAILATAILVLVCFKNQTSMSNRLQNIVHNLVNSVGLRAPNPMPDFRFKIRNTNVKKLKKMCFNPVIKP